MEGRSRLKDLRAISGLSQVEAAKRLGMTQANYNYLENGDRNGTIATWARIQRLYRIPDCDMWGIIAK